MPSFSVLPEPEGFLFSGFRALVSQTRSSDRNTLKDQFMKTKLSFALAAAGLSFLCAARATTITENFTNNPALDGWQVFGDTNLFQWDPVKHDLKVTWDSSQTNSYFYHPLGTILGTNDNFSMSFDLLLTDYTIGVNPDLPTDFPLASGLMNYAEASSTNFLRGGYPTEPDLAEFDFFQWDDVQPFPDTNTVWPTFVDSANDFYYNGTSSYGVVELPTNVVMHVAMNYTAANQTCVLSITTNGSAVVAPVVVTLADSYGFGDYHLDTFAVESYSDYEGDGSLLAHGTIGNIVLVVPPPPVGSLQIALSNNVARAQFASATNWNYVLLGSSNLVTWSTNGAVTAGTGGNLILPDTNSLQRQQFYQVEALRQD